MVVTGTGWLSASGHVRPCLGLGMITLQVDSPIAPRRNYSGAMTMQEGLVQG